MAVLDGTESGPCAQVVPNAQESSVFSPRIGRRKTAFRRHPGRPRRMPEQARENSWQRGEYRTLFLSPAALTLERNLLARHDAHCATEILDMPLRILEAFCALAQRAEDDDGTLQALGNVLEIAFRGVREAHDLYEQMEPADTRTCA